MYAYGWKYPLTHFYIVLSSRICIMMSHIVYGTYIGCVVVTSCTFSSLQCVCGRGEERWYALPTNVCVAWNVENFAS